MIARLLTVLVCLLSLNGCASSALQQSWSAPDAQAHALGKSVVFAQLASEADRRRSEDLFAQVLAPAMDVSAGYAVVGESVTDASALARAKAQALKLGYGSALVVKVVSTRDERVYRPGSPFMFPPGFGYYGRHGYIGHPFMMDPGYYETLRVAVVELSLYALQGEHLVWSANAEVIDSANLEGVVRRLADAMLKDLLAKGVLP
ncbi:hypothetical protein [Denitromonas ohlonensis]|uniref:DUF4136 domain-containing protein n=2 Tax=Denitromonas TaxID=139331 RepID=A0A557RR32_9RHOO|nr:hypothetical protein [Denitromonas ohlonensis]TVT46067.1 MAG: hypothetical protein FHP94_17695 [Denitromonas halophila]TVO67629.1 hypothetical protein FHP90_06620 [Denitromonas ohlonensis]TVO76487.1 hypothetical protein FHP89_10315 [Denitromonas ohlonensis]TVT70714.1 MAG: hypothetical protein FHP92_17335 [Denitromonas halophila]TVT74223.1 MAG: hypothetical protein FHP93_04655 [Denitromonas halophila]